MLLQRRREIRSGLSNSFLATIRTDIEYSEFGLPRARIFHITIFQYILEKNNIFLRNIQIIFHLTVNDKKMTYSIVLIVAETKGEHIFF